MQYIYLSPTELRRLPRVALLALLSVEDSACLHSGGCVAGVPSLPPSCIRDGPFSSSRGFSKMFIGTEQSIVFKNSDTGGGGR